MGSTWTSTISIVLARKVNETASRCLCLTFQPDFKNDIKCIRYVLYCEMLESHFHTAAWMLLLVLLPDDFIYGILNVCKDKKKKKDIKSQLPFSAQINQPSSKKVEGHRHPLYQMLCIQRKDSTNLQGN